MERTALDQYGQLTKPFTQQILLVEVAVYPPLRGYYLPQLQTQEW
jgi:hypothetical protein